MIKIRHLIFTVIVSGCVSDSSEYLPAQYPRNTNRDTSVNPKEVKIPTSETENIRVEQLSGMTECYVDDSLQCVGFKFDYQYLFPLKGHHLYGDSVYVKIPYENGIIWYEGEYIRYGKKRFKYLGTGIHIIRSMAGSTKGVIDYSRKTVKSVDSKGEASNFSFDEYLIIERHMSKWTEVDSSAF